MSTTDTEAPVIPDPVAIDDLVDTLETIREAEIKKLKEAAEQWQRIHDGAQERIKARLGEAEAGTLNGHTAVTWKHRHVSRVDATKLRESLGDELLRAQGFLKDSIERRFELVD
jgi:predicted phage-related endonuclease